MSEIRFCGSDSKATEEERKSAEGVKPRVEKRIGGIFDHVIDFRNYFTAKQAAAYFAVSERTIRRLYMSEGLPYFKIGRCIRFTKEDLDSYAMARRID